MKQSFTLQSKRKGKGHVDIGLFHFRLKALYISRKKEGEKRKRIRKDTSSPLTIPAESLYVKINQPNS